MMKEEKALFDHPENLLSEFEANTYEQWKEIAEGSLKGKPLEKIIKKTLENINIQPIYDFDSAKEIIDFNSMPGFYPFDRGNCADGYNIKKWHITQEIPYPTPTLLNAALKSDLVKGQTAISIVGDGLSKNGINPSDNNGLFKSGTSIFCTQDYEELFKEIDLSKTPVYLNMGLAGIQQYALFINYLKNNEIELSTISGGLFFDPIAFSLDSNFENVNTKELYKQLSSMLKSTNEMLPSYKPLCIDSTIYHEAGADAVQEVAFGLATGTQHIKSVHNDALSVDDLAGKMFFNVSYGPVFFIEIAKVRAMRKLWARIVKEFGGNENSGNMHIFARTSKFNKSRLDQYVNLLRNTTEALSAILSGCNELHVEFFDEPFGLPSEFSRRVARNIQLVLMEECNLPDVIDPVGGTWFVEKLTDEIAQQAWELFLEIEKQGGMVKAIENNFVQNAIEEKAKQRQKQLSLRKDILVGTNKYPNKNEKKASLYEYDNKKLSEDRLSYAKEIKTDSNTDKNISSFTELMDMAASGATLQDLFNNFSKNIDNSFKKLKPIILCEMFEVIREKPDIFKTKTGRLPKVFLANIGTVKEYKSRADFSSDFFSVGGFDVINKIGHDNWEEVAKDAIESQSEVIAICSSDTKYPEFVPQFCRLIKRAKPLTILVLAGYPKDHIDEFKAAGLDEFIHIKSDIVYTLSKIFGSIGT